MGTTVSENFGNALRYARSSGISPESPQTLQDLLEALRTHTPEEGKLQRMLVTTAGHLCQALGEPPHKITINMLLDAKARLQAHLRSQGKRRTSIHAYSNYTQVLLKKAREFGWNEDSEDVASTWKDIQRATMTVKGSAGIIRYAIQKGKEPKNFGESDLLGWSVSAVDRGLRFEYVRKVKARFRKSVFAAGLDWQIPNLAAPVSGRCYGIPISDFPEPLCSQVFELVKWKTAKFQLGRPIKAKHRAVTSDSLLGLLSRLLGFLVGIAGKLFALSKTCFRQTASGSFRAGRSTNGDLMAVPWRCGSARFGPWVRILPSLRSTLIGCRI